MKISMVAIHGLKTDAGHVALRRFKDQPETNTAADANNGDTGHLSKEMA